MIARPLWFVAGAGAGIYAMLRARRLAVALTPEGLRDRAGAALLGAQLLAEDVRAGRDQRETELREQFGLPRGRPELAAGSEKRKALPDGHR